MYYAKFSDDCQYNFTVSYSLLFKGVNWIIDILLSVSKELLFCYE